MYTWIVPTPNLDPDSADPVYKLAAAALVASFDFGNFDELEPVDTALAGTPTVTASPAGLTVGTPTLDAGGYAVRVPVSGGAAGTDYVLTCTTVTAAGQTLIGRGTLKVR